MKITALDIRQKTFEKSFRGVDKDEVQAFLNTVSQQWERLGDENRELRLKLEHAQQDVQKLREVESSLYRTLKTAEDTGNSITEQAQREADLRRREAQLLAEQTVAEARQRARAIVEEAYQMAEKNVADMQQEVGGLGQDCQRLEQHLDALVRDLHHLASDALEKAERARARPKNGPAAILSRAASVQVKRPADAASAEPSASPTPPLPLCSPLPLPSPAPPPTIPSLASSPTPVRPPRPTLSGPRPRAKTPASRRPRALTSPAPKPCPRRPRPSWSPPAPRLRPSAPTGPTSSSPSP